MITKSEPLVVADVLKLIRESCQLRNEAPLNFVSLRSLVDGVGWGALSRVEMNALRAPLTALPNREDKCVLDEADDFIDSDKPSLEKSRNSLETGYWGRSSFHASL
jgi:hypothetical protein